MSPTEKPMSIPTRRAPAFAPTVPALTVAAPATAQPADEPATNAAGPHVARPDRGSRDVGSPQLSVARADRPGGDRLSHSLRMLSSERSYLIDTQRQLADDGVSTDLTEMLHALVYGARRGELDLLELIRTWRRDLHAI